MPIELCPVAIRVCGKGVRRGKGAGSGFVPYGGKGGKGDGENGGGAGHDIVAAGGADGAPLAVPPLFNTTNLRVSFKDSTQPSHVEIYLSGEPGWNGYSAGSGGAAYCGGGRT